MTQQRLPVSSECLACFIDRALEEVGCDNTLRLAGRYRDDHAPGDVGLERRLAAHGGYCDCEILGNTYQPQSGLTPHLIELPDGGGVVPVVMMPPCSGVPDGSTDACRNWEKV
jgi:hypothetical protein